MKHANGLFVAGCLVALAGAPHAQVRTWGFSVDAVYEYGGSNSASLANQGTDTLRFDTVTLEIVKPALSTYGVGFSRIPSGQYHVVNCSNGTCNQQPTLKSVPVNPGSSITLSGFFIDVNGYPPIAKRAESAAIGDTMQARLIFQAAAGRGRDTLIVNGIQQTTALRPFAGSPSPYKGSGILFDPLGRVWKSADGKKAIFVPLMAPKE